ncbi:unnamed protein product, partial [Polarella glacialis]
MSLAMSAAKNSMMWPVVLAFLLLFHPAEAETTTYENAGPAPSPTPSTTTTGDPSTTTTSEWWHYQLATDCLGTPYEQGFVKANTCIRTANRTSRTLATVGEHKFPYDPYTLNFLATGCPNRNVAEFVRAEWRSLYGSGGETAVLASMKEYCESVSLALKTPADQTLVKKRQHCCGNEPQCSVTCKVLDDFISNLQMTWTNSSNCRGAPSEVDVVEAGACYGDLSFPSTSIPERQLSVGGTTLVFGLSDYGALDCNTEPNKYQVFQTDVCAKDSPTESFRWTCSSPGGGMQKDDHHTFRKDDTWFTAYNAARAGSQQSGAPHFAFGDVDKDGFLDMVWCDENFEVRASQGTGDGFVNIPGSLLSLGAPASVSLADWNLDGFLDMLLCDYETGNLTYIPGVPQPPFFYQSWDFPGYGGEFLSQYGSSMKHVVAALSDWDNDGDIDMLVTMGIPEGEGSTRYDYTFGVFGYNSDGKWALDDKTYLNVSSLFSGAIMSTGVSMTVVDFDGDGNLDVLFVGAGKVVFAQKVWSPTTQSWVLSVPFPPPAALDGLSLPMYLSIAMVALPAGSGTANDLVVAEYSGNFTVYHRVFPSYAWKTSSYSTFDECLGNSPEQWCSKNLIGQSTAACCPAFCGTCGGDNCSFSEEEGVCCEAQVIARATCTDSSSTGCGMPVEATGSCEARSTIDAPGHSAAFGCGSSYYDFEHGDSTPFTAKDTGTPLNKKISGAYGIDDVLWSSMVRIVPSGQLLIHTANAQDNFGYQGQNSACAQMEDVAYLSVTILNASQSILVWVNITEMPNSLAEIHFNGTTGEVENTMLLAQGDPPKFNEGDVWYVRVEEGWVHLEMPDKGEEELSSWKWSLDGDNTRRLEEHSRRLEVAYDWLESGDDDASDGSSGYPSGDPSTTTTSTAGSGGGGGLTSITAAICLKEHLAAAKVTAVRIGCEDLSRNASFVNECTTSLWSWAGLAHCPVQLAGRQDSCSAFCAGNGRTCIKAMKSKGAQNCTRDLAGQCHQSMANCGCDQVNEEQICVCSSISPVAMSSTIQCASTADPCIVATTTATPPTQTTIATTIATTATTTGDPSYGSSGYPTTDDPSYGSSGYPTTDDPSYGSSGYPTTDDPSYGSSGYPTTDDPSYGSSGYPTTDDPSYGSSGYPTTDDPSYGSSGYPTTDDPSYGSSGYPSTDDDPSYGSSGYPSGDPTTNTTTTTTTMTTTSTTSTITKTTTTTTMIITTPPTTTSTTRTTTTPTTTASTTNKGCDAYGGGLLPSRANSTDCGPSNL